MNFELVPSPQRARCDFQMQVNVPGEEVSFYRQRLAMYSLSVGNNFDHEVQRERCQYLYDYHMMGMDPVLMMQRVYYIFHPRYVESLPSSQEQQDNLP